ncbi:hypothetical protein L3Q82_003510 [Scortum barcoo]|uniref:Uncharacterized protein n=1 Tax=Scortum barcoo TaxID=214431 RepID=A0ACB8VMK8_9TELE|nr:hypothetical protein L3Q82_003510 [Scortum barcoo]
MFKHKGVHQCTWHQDTLGRRSMIDFVVVSSDLRPYVLDTRVKRGLSLSTDHHLVVSWLRWQRRKLDRPGRPKRIVRVCWERLAEPSVREVFNSHLRKSFSQIPREAGDIESEWTMFSASIVDAGSSKLWTQGLWIDRYRQAKQAAARAVLEAKTRVWEEFGEAMEEDYRSASKRFWQTVRRLRRGKQYSANTVYSAGGKLLTSTEDIVGRWKKYFEDLLNPTDLPSSEEAEAGDSEVDSSITRRPKSLSLPREGHYARVLERENRPCIVDPWIQEEQCGFHVLVVEQWTSSIPSTGCLEGLWEFAQPVHMCFVDLEKAFDRVPRGILWGVLREYGVRGPLLRAVRSLYDRSRSLVRIAGSKSDLFPVHVGLRQGCPLSPVLFIIFMDRISRRSQGPEGVRFGNHRISSLLLQMMLSCWLLQARTFSMCWSRFAAECEAAGMRISTSKSEAMVLDRKRGGVPSPGGWRGPASSGGVQVSPGSCSRVRERWSVRLIDRRIGAASAVMRSVYRTVVR